MTADVAVSTQLQQWSFEKPALNRPERSVSSASSPDLSHLEPDTLRIDAPAAPDSASPESTETLELQERYLSSEEDLSPMEGSGSESEYDYDEDDVSIHDAQQECLSAKKMSISRWDKGKSCDRAVTVSYQSAGRPKMINLANAGSPVTREPAQRSASLAQLPVNPATKLRAVDQSTRMSWRPAPTTTRSPSPAVSLQSRRPSTGTAAPVPSQASSAPQNTESSAASFKTASSVRSTSPSLSEHSLRPASAAANSVRPRSSLYVTSTLSNSPIGPQAPLTPQSPEPHAFLSTDPYDNSTTNAASPIIKSSPHKRLRSISQKLSLAKIAITPSTKKWDSRVNGKPSTPATNMPPTPATPYTPMTPQTAPMNNSSSMSPMKLRRNSRVSRPTTGRGPSPETPPVPELNPAPLPRRHTLKMVARGADERAPTIELPPCPDQADSSDAHSSIKSRRVRKRKSLMDLL